MALLWFYGHTRKLGDTRTVGRFENEHCILERRHVRLRVADRASRSPHESRPWGWCSTLPYFGGRFSRRRSAACVHLEIRADRVQGQSMSLCQVESLGRTRGERIPVLPAVQTKYPSASLICQNKSTAQEEGRWNERGQEGSGARGGD